MEERMILVKVAHGFCPLYVRHGKRTIETSFIHL